ncbi:protein of unknown function (plasmid) [Pararobbsia alpina]
MRESDIAGVHTPEGTQSPEGHRVATGVFIGVTMNRRVRLEVLTWLRRKRPKRWTMYASVWTRSCMQHDSAVIFSVV